VEEILPMLSSEFGPDGWSVKRVPLDGELVNIHSARLSTFRRSTVCACCGIAGAFFVKERHRKLGKKQEPFFHLNLYALDKNGKEVMMTSDHIIPRGNGGQGLENNRQTMCTRCNRIKGNRLISNEALASELGFCGSAVSVT
jgi:5-methylcytosine-specific restriction endonuclease McrA